MPGELISVTIDSLSYNGGRGVGRHEGVVVFIANTAPGDLVEARVTEKKPRFWVAELVRILRPSPDRREPPCPVAGRCGGCPWQHVSYAQQVVQKEKILRDSLRSLTKMSEERGEVFTWRAFLAAANEFYYRNRIQVHTHEGKVGFLAAKSQDLVATDHCWIAEPQLNEKLRAIQLELSGSLFSGQPARLTAEKGKTRHELGGSLFSQVNSAQNEVLKLKTVSAIGENPRPDWILDLYCGSGNLTFSVLERFNDIPLIGIEMSAGAIERARKSAAERGYSNSAWMAGDVGEVLKTLRPQKGKGFVVVDPPRAGVSQLTIDQVLRHSPRQILYISCNPTTFARDAEKWLRSSRYQLQWVQGLDMFPQTEHVELIALLCAAP